jgi:4-hydroxy-4-methyl-2-oxoglutarate aldolase
MTQLGSLAERLQGCYSGAVFDVLRAKGFLKHILPQYIRPVNLQHKLAGPVFTIEGRRNDSLHPVARQNPKCASKAILQRVSQHEMG